MATYKEIEGDVVAFVSRPESDNGLHSVVNTGAAGSYRIPPQSLIVLPEAPVNGGMWYAQGAHPQGPAVYLFSEFERRTIATLAAVEEQLLASAMRRTG